MSGNVIKISINQSEKIIKMLKEYLSRSRFDVSASILSVAMFVFLFLTIRFSDTTIDRDTISYLIASRHTDYWVLWNVHFLYGAYLKIFYCVVHDLMAASAFLSASSTLVILLGGYAILKNHLPQKQAFWGFLLLLVLPGFHLLNIRVEDNLPFLAGLVLFALGMDNLFAGKSVIKNIILAGAGFAISILFHTISLIYILLPLVYLLKFDIKWKERIRFTFYLYLAMLVPLILVLYFVPFGFGEFLSAFNQGHGFFYTVSAYLNDTSNTFHQMKQEFGLIFRVVNNIPTKIESINLTARFGFELLIWITNILFYGYILRGIYRAIKSRKGNPVLWSFLIISGCIPFIIFSFTIERLDAPVFFALILGSIGFWQNNQKEINPWLTRWIFSLFVILIFWDGILYAQSARWIYKPESYKYYKKIASLNKTENLSFKGILFDYEKSLYSEKDYFVFMKEHLDKKHYAIDSTGLVVCIKKAWENNRVVLDSAGVQSVFYSDIPVLCTTTASQRLTKHYGDRANCFILKDE